MRSFDDPDTYTTEDVLVLAAPTLFASRYVVWVESLSQAPGGENVWSNEAKTFIDSAHDFICIEESLTADLQAKLKKAGAAMYSEKRSAQISGKTSFSIFALSDALLYRDKKLLWVLYQKALRAGFSVEEIFGTLFWALKTALLVSGGYTEGLHPFVIRKTQTALRNFTQGGLPQLSFRLLTDYHQARRGAGAELLLEKFILEL